MWINTEDIKRLMNGELDAWGKNRLSRKIQEAEAREEERQRRKIAERVDFYQRICDLLAERTPNAVTPTDLQFMYYNKYHEQIACSKVARACRTLYFYTDRYQTQEVDTVPARLQHVHLMPSGGRKSKRIYYKWGEK